MTIGGEKIADIDEVEIPPDRTIIDLKPDAIHENVTEAEDALIAAGLPIFQRGGRYLVKPVSICLAASNGRETTSPQLKRLDEPEICDCLSQVAVFRKQLKNGTTDIPPPDKIVEILLSRYGEWRFPQVAGIVSTPTLRPDGSLLINPGYDPSTKLYYAPEPGFAIPTKMLENIEHPSEEYAISCLDLIKELLSEFSFKTDIDKAVALSAIFTAVVKGAVDLTPLHAFSAPEAGTGKSFLCDVISAIATGNYCPVVAADKDDKETDKRLTGLLLSGLPIMSIDNVEEPLGSSLLCQAVERPLIEVRPLGTSKMVLIESRALFLATGNNFRLRGDMAARRGLRCELDAGMERPETRQFQKNPFDEVCQKRGLYVGAVLAIIRAALAAHSKVELTPLQSYNAWSRFVREPLVWLGCADPAESIRQIRNDDPERAALLAVLTSWYAVFGKDPVTVATIVKKAAAVIDRTTNQDDDTPASSESQSISDLREALLTVAGGRSGGINNVRFGKWLSANKDKRLDGYQLLDGGNTRTGAKQWKVSGPGAEAAGDSPPRQPRRSGWQPRHLAIVRD